MNGNTDSNSISPIYQNQENQENPYKIPTTDKLKTDLQLSFSSIFTKYNFILLIGFLVVYFILFYIIKAFSNDTEGNQMNSQLNLSRTIDVFIFGIVLIILVMVFYTLMQSDNKNIITQLLLWSKAFFDDPTTPFTFTIFIFIFYTIIYLCGIPMTPETKPLSISIIEQKLFIVLITVFIINFFKYVFGISLMNLMFGANNELIKLWKNLPDEFNYDACGNKIHSVSGNKIHSVSGGEIDPSGNKIVPVIKPKEEVFHISNNLYTYDDAPSICSALGARLANYDDIEKMYNDGGEFCEYGWSEGQMALFPTQKDTWDKLQKQPGKESNCGRKGVNGGVIANSQIKFGVNCFGVKQSGTIADINRFTAITDTIGPKNIQDEIMDAKVKYWKDNKDSLIINSFNNKKWSEY